ncbi:uncharacterized protein BXZ73DRAFT_104501 [Epithele typhae]|uniref:uncharacterized protein n=1 Tax=Epithele typhae TaxID=378194 RepID=UPI00200754EE|nr:uncharacterized protein BXZ73DRAFT_104501 [Epithele typhae]KAH9921213.1 hypothetical protein BXZ73DRAFT_104501 [Epithele typhae]
MAPPIDRLNNDVLLIILSYLKKRDLCALSLTRKRFRMVSSPRLWTVLPIDEAFFVSWWHDNLPTNAHYVREIAIHLNFDKLPDVLFATKNIRSLEITDMSLLHDDPRLSIALAELRELRELSCGSVEDKMLPTIQSIPSPNLTSLCIGYQGHEDVPYNLPPLISAIASFPRLHSLMIEQASNPTTAVDIARYPPFASIQQLYLNGVTEAATDLVYLCPNLTSLELGFDDLRTEDPHKSRPTWRPSPIPRLTLTVLRMRAKDPIVSLLEQRAVRATHVRLSMLWWFTRDGISFTKREPASRLSRVLAVLKPRSLYLEASVAPDAKLSDPTRPLWKEVAAAAPHLRALVLHVESSDEVDTEFDVDSINDDTEVERPRMLWMPPDTLAAELARLPLVCVYLKADPRLFDRKPGEPDAEHQRLRALAAFPEKLAAAIPTLRVVGVSDGRLKLEGVRYTQWWRVERGNGGDAPSLVELWREDGERALRLVQHEAFCMSDLDDIYSEKCRYVPG